MEKTTQLIHILRSHKQITHGPFFFSISELSTIFIVSTCTHLYRYFHSSYSSRCSLQNRPQYCMSLHFDRDYLYMVKLKDKDYLYMVKLKVRLFVHGESESKIERTNLNIQPLDDSIITWGKISPETKCNNHHSTPFQRTIWFCLLYWMLYDTKVDHVTYNSTVVWQLWIKKH